MKKILIAMILTISTYSSADIFERKLNLFEKSCNSSSIKDFSSNLKSLEQFTLEKTKGYNRHNYLKAMYSEKASAQFFALLAPYAFAPFINDNALTNCYDHYKSFRISVAQEKFLKADQLIEKWTTCYKADFPKEDLPRLMKLIKKCYKNKKAQSN